jgi:hypothetical protein
MRVVYAENGQAGIDALDSGPGARPRSPFTFRLGGVGAVEAAARSVGEAPFFFAWSSPALSGASRGVGAHKGCEAFVLVA